MLLLYIESLASLMQPNSWPKFKVELIGSWKDNTGSWIVWKSLSTELLAILSKKWGGKVFIISHQKMLGHAVHLNVVRLGHVKVHEVNSNLRGHFSLYTESAEFSIFIGLWVSRGSYLWDCEIINIILGPLIRNLNLLEHFRHGLRNILLLHSKGHLDRSLLWHHWGKCLVLWLGT